jgi:propionyl-CoA carboxylase alpha chain
VKKLLIANRGEIARRVARTARAMGIATVSVYSDPDVHAPHVADTDEAVALGGSTPADSYLDIAKVMAAVVATGADAVHPGYGFLSENADFARACQHAGVIFVGPSPEAIEAMGSKITAKELMAEAGIPVLSDQGFPLLVKAAFGGGGRGMRIARDRSGLDEARAAASREAASAFGDGTVFLEHYVDDPRHIEVQIFGDTHGKVIHLFERECSIQRRYQKIVEEAPSPAVDPDLRQRLCDAAIAAGRALDYVGAGTVEFVLDPNGDFFFLEVNTRLQVEHPVTELVTGLDLVELQLRVARGEPLDVEPTLKGWAVEARLYAEDVSAGFAPASGLIRRFDIPDAEGVRVDAGYVDGSTVSTFYDAMLAKVIASGDTRDQAINRLTDVLHRARIHGVPTNRRLLESVLRHAEFRSGAIDTGFFDRHDPVAMASESFDPLAPVAAAVAAVAQRRAAARVQPMIPWGWRNVAAGPERASFMVGDRSVEVTYTFGRRGVTFAVDGDPVPEVLLWEATPALVDISAGGVRRRYLINRFGSVVMVNGPTGEQRLETVERLPEPAPTTAPGSMLAPMPGSVTGVACEVGDLVAAGEVLVILEAMKMEHPIAAGEGGLVVELLVSAGDQVESGQLLAVIARPEEPDDA